MTRDTRRTIGRALIGMTISIALAGNVGMAAELEAAPGPGLCFEAITGSIDERAWIDVLDAISGAADAQPDFFSDTDVLTVPDLGSTWDATTAPTIKFGVWDIGPDTAYTTDQLRDALAVHDCRVGDATWGARLSRDLLFAAAERILASAKIPDETGEAPIPENATTEIAVDHYPDENRIRTLLKFNVPVAFFNPGGECWIDDVLASDGPGSRPTSLASHGQQTDPLVGSACDRFKAFMTAGGLGERALSLLPDEIALSDGGSISLAASAAEVSTDALVLGGTIDDTR